MGSPRKVYQVLVGRRVSCPLLKDHDGHPAFIAGTHHQALFKIRPLSGGCCFKINLDYSYVTTRSLIISTTLVIMPDVLRVDPGEEKND